MDRVRAVMMMGEMSLDDSDEKSGKMNDQDELHRMTQEVHSKGKVMHVEMSDL